MARPAHQPPNDVALPLTSVRVAVSGPVLTYVEWLATLRRGDTVRVRTHTGETMPSAMVTNETPCYVFVGRLKFWRRHGWQVERQGKQVYRMRLRLVRDEKELQ